MTLLIIGATGTIGRQIARIALYQGQNVKCLVRNLRKAAFLKEWGAELVYADLKIPSSLPMALKGVTCIIDASTTRPYEFLTSEEVDWVGKKNLLKAAQQAKIKRFIFLSVLNTHVNSKIPFLNLKLHFENLITKSKLNYTIYYLPSLFQGIISQYAVPILDGKTIVVPKDDNVNMYMEAEDIAWLVLQSTWYNLNENKRVPLLTTEKLSTQQIIKVCENSSGQKAKTFYIPNFILQSLASFFQLFKWSWTLSEQLNFVDSENKQKITQSFTQTNVSEDFIHFDLYINDFFNVMLKKLKELNVKKSDSPIF